MNQYSYKENIKLLLNLLDNAESILSIINLSDISISKYNKLKQITFNKLNLKFFPLVKKSPNNINNENCIYNNFEVEPITLKLFFQSIKKSMFIKYLINFINNENVNELRCQLNDIYNFNINSVCNQNLKQIEFEMNIEEKKLENLYNKCNEIFHNKNDFYFNGNNNDNFNKNNNLNNNYKTFNSRTYDYNKNHLKNKSMNLDFNENNFNENNNYNSNFNKSLNNILKPSEEFHKKFQDAMKFVNNIEIKIDDE